MYRLGWLVLVVSLFGCNGNCVYETSGVISERARIIKVLLSPTRHLDSARLGQVALTSIGGGSDYQNLKDKKITKITEIELLPKFITIFACQHGEFEVDNREVYLACRFRVGDSVTVNFQEIYRVRYEGEGSNRKLLKRTLIDSELIGCFFD